MFTGIVDDVGTIEHVSETPAGVELRVRCRYTDLVEGESIALNGACLTVRECLAGTFTVAAMATTLDRTTIATWRAGTRVNLERAMRLGDRLGGHLVQGHVDGVGVVRGVARTGSSLLLDIAVSEDIAPLLVPHGSVTIDGVSLTVNALPEQRVVQVALIEYTEGHTTLGALTAGDHVHVEGDMIGKYVQQLLRMPSPSH
jgi:riboflavin synthase